MLGQFCSEGREVAFATLSQRYRLHDQSRCACGVLVQNMPPRTCRFSPLVRRILRHLRQCRHTNHAGGRSLSRPKQDLLQRNPAATPAQRKKEKKKEEGKKKTATRKYSVFTQKWCMERNKVKLGSNVGRSRTAFWGGWNVNASAGLPAGAP